MAFTEAGGLMDYQQNIGEVHRPAAIFEVIP